MRNYINQFYNEGFATTFYLKPKAYLEKNIKNKLLLLILNFLLKTLYTLFVLLFAWYVFWKKYPL